MAETSNNAGILKRGWRVLVSPSARWSILSLLAAGIAVGAGGVIFTQVAAETTSSTEFCANACHSMQQFTAPEYRGSRHATNAPGVAAGCGDCHIPHGYPYKLVYKARAGIADLVAEARGVIGTKEKYEKERWRMANKVWHEMRSNDSANCRRCHDWNAMALSAQRPAAQKSHDRARKSAGKMTCIDCHTGVAHTAPEEPAAAPPGKGKTS
jgi:nitrate/TMAO reductase-like tetraheme cytochrome c subunit